MLRKGLSKGGETYDKDHHRDDARSGQLFPPCRFTGNFVRVLTMVYEKDRDKDLTGPFNCHCGESRNPEKSCSLLDADILRHDEGLRMESLKSGII